MQYWLGPWQWITDGSVPGPSWNPPVGAIAAIKLHGVDATTDQRHGFFAMPDGALRPPGYTMLGSGDCRQIPSTSRMRSDWRAVTGYTPAGSKLVDLLWDQLTNGAEAGAEGGPGPLVPRHDGTTNLLLMGHSPVKSLLFGRQIKGNTRWSQVLTAQLRRNFAGHWEHNQAVGRKVLGEYVRKYGLGDDWRHVVPPNLRPHVPGPSRPETAYSDVLSGRTEAMNAGNWQYYTTSQNFQVVTAGAYLASGSGYRQAEYASALSSDDHWSEFEWVVAVASCGPCVRSTNYNSTTPSHYYSQQYSGQMYISEVNSGGPTNLANSANTHAIGNVDRLLVDGSDLEGYCNGVLKVSTTDTTITGSTSVGVLFVVASGSATFKNWAGEDIASAITVSVGQSSETDSSLPVSISRTASVGIASESDSSLSASPSRSVSVGIASESDSGLSVGHSATVQVGIASEANSAFAVTLNRSAGVGLATESDSANQSTISKSVSVGQASESDSSLAISPSRSVSIGIASETDSALAITASISVSASQSSESDFALSATVVRSVSVGIASESDSSLAIASAKSVNVGIATEANSALVVTATGAIDVGQSAETDSALPVSVIRSNPVGLATETDNSQALSIARTVAIGQVSESDSATSISIIRSVQVGQSAETDSANDISVVVPDQIGQSQETDSALATSIRRTIPVGIAAESDSTLSTTAVRSVSVGIASEANSALMVGIKRVFRVGLAIESDSALRLSNESLSETGFSAIQISDRLYRRVTAQDRLKFMSSVSDRLKTKASASDS